MKLIIAILLLLTFTGMYAQEQFLYPRNEIFENEGVSIFVENLREVIKYKDTTGLYIYLDEDILNSFGGNGGIPEFKQYWSLKEGSDEIWKTLDELLNLGGTLNHDYDSKEVVGATWPYTFTEFPGKLDAYDHVIVTGSGVALRKGPSADSKIITRLSYNILEFDNQLTYSNPDNPFNEESGDVDWYAIKFKGEIGYMTANYVRSPIGYRMSVYLTEKGWKITMLVAGD